MSQVIIHRCEQGSAEWHQARAGVITASMFKVARERVGGLTEQQETFVRGVLSGLTSAQAAAAAGYRGAPKITDKIEVALAGGDPSGWSEAAKNYAFRLAVERISGEPSDGGFETWQMRRGHELEPDARQAHADRIGKAIERVGFVTTTDGLFGASLDGLIDGEPAGSEYKCIVGAEQMRDVLLTGDIGSYTDQVQGGMWVCDLDRFDLCIYCPQLAKIGRELTVFSVPRDQTYIDNLASDLAKFKGLVDAYERSLRNE